MEIVIITLLIAFLIVEILNNVRIYEIQRKLNKKETVKMTEEEKRKMEELKKNFDNLMNYDENIAMKRK